MLIWRNEKVINHKNEVLLDEKYEEKYSVVFIEDIKIYLIDNRYIRIDGKPVIGIYNSNKIPQLEKTLLIWRNKAKELKIGELFIISNLNIKEKNNSKLFNAFYMLPPNDLFENEIIENTREKYYYYYGLLNINIISDMNKNNFTIYKGTMLEFDNSTINKKGKIFRNYSPEIFYLFNKYLIEWTKDNYNMSNRIIFVNSWNNYFILKEHI
jgi:hypothetical protein